MGILHCFPPSTFAHWRDQILSFLSLPAVSLPAIAITALASSVVAVGLLTCSDAALQVSVGAPPALSVCVQFQLQWRRGMVGV